MFLFLTNCSIVEKRFNANIEYAELLFKKENGLTQQLMMLSDEELSLADEESISQAELKMNDDCQLLNESVNRRMEGKSMSFFFRRRVLNSLDACEESVKNMEAVLLSIGAQ